MTTTNQEELKKTQDKTFTLNLTADKEFIQEEYQKILKEIKEKFKSPGFRDGKAPTDILEKNVDKEEIMKELIPKVISKIYSDKVKQYELKPIIQPKVTIKTTPIDIDKDWEFEIVGAEIPDVKIDPKYQEEIKKFNQENKEKNEKQQNGIIEILLKNTEITIPSVVIDHDLQYQLSKLVDQANQANITVEQYLSQKNTNAEEYRKDLTARIEKEWKINLIIDEIGKTANVKIEPKEVQDIIAKNPNLQSNINLVYYLLQQQKVFEYLSNL